ncbi:methyltransferase, FxLD system, partial [Streptomyces sp. NPDC041003]
YIAPRRRRVSRSMTAVEVFSTSRPPPATAVSAGGLDEALRGPRHEVTTAVTVRSGEYFGSLQLFAATTLPAFCRLAATVDKGTGVTQIGKGADVPALLDGTSLAYLIYVHRGGDNPQGEEWEFVVHAFGEQGPRIARQLAATVRAWDTDVRGADDPALSVHPAGTPDHRLPPGDVLDRKHCRLVFQWPGRDALLPAPAHPPTTPAALPEPR